MRKRISRLRWPVDFRQRAALRLVHGATTDALVLLYHRVAEPELDPQLLSVSPEHFAEHLEVLTGHGPLLPLTGIRGARAGFAVTFDDGYADNLVAAELLAAAGVPATVFVVAGLLGQSPWWDELSRLVLLSPMLPPVIELEIGGRRHTWEVSTGGPPDRSWNVLSAVADGPRTALYRELFAELRPRRDGERASAISQLADQVDEPGDGGECILTPEELEELAQVEGMEVGAHTCTHPVLSTLPRECQRMEIVEAKRLLEEVIGSRISSFAYPFGSFADYGPETVEFVRGAGFARACINDPARLRSRADRFRLPRFLVRDWDGDEFERRLRSWLAS